ncbi:hypothetical protein [Phyllobacterium myrsinacearum]|uniref:Uncharacterized protein YodC (DUF2158 family) n=1 Tax=Phyllobacterium myrsinacearum TaxID=28101 RepID=A0A839EW68_9HYPH|nr:hypothetical protein [Phyllobacterium myrsinacearum]MBA8881764.1 uncharacterized protein YodC (DUF2158 family) [Phyllobacterium myrsinacearum]
MLRALLCVGFALTVSGAQAAEPAGLVICRVVSNQMRELSFKVGQRFLLTYRFDNGAITWIFPDGGGREIPCKANGDYLTCPWYDGYSAVFNRKNLTFSFPNTIGPSTSESSCRSLDINALPE